MFSSHFELVYNQITEGVKIQVLHHDEAMMMTEFTLDQGAKLPEHFHESNHSAYLLKGKIRLITEGYVRDFVQGDSWSMNKNICHSTEALENSVVLEVFNSEHENIGFQVYQKANMIGI
jgi:quercetin dioxygenase-like cupin family protein